MIGNFPGVLNFDWFFLKLTRFICNSVSSPCSMCIHIAEKTNIYFLYIPFLLGQLDYKGKKEGLLAVMH
jgi:hypothetical protein